MGRFPSFSTNSDTDSNVSCIDAIQKFSSSVVFFVVSSTSGSTMAKVLLYIRLYIYIYKGRNPADDFFLPQKNMPLLTWALQTEKTHKQVWKHRCFPRGHFHPWANSAAAGSLSLLDAGLATGHWGASRCRYQVLLGVVGWLYWYLLIVRHSASPCCFWVQRICRAHVVPMPYHILHIFSYLSISKVRSDL